jgi:hypothetical protein
MYQLAPPADKGARKFIAFETTENVAVAVSSIWQKI